jgi:hypothetical protein
MPTKPNRRVTTVVDVPADNPVGTMERFNDGLRRVLSAPKTPLKIRPARNKRRK